MIFSVLVIFSDLYARRVSNRWLLAALAVGFLLHVYTWLSGQAGFPLAALLGLIIGLAALLPFYAIGWMGAGDVKFFSVLGFLLGWQALLPIWVIASLLAGAHVFAVLVLPRLPALAPLKLQFCLQTTQTQWSQHPWWQRVQAARQGRHGIPYAAYLGIGAIATCLARGLP